MALKAVQEHHAWDTQRVEGFWSQIRHIDAVLNDFPPRDTITTAQKQNIRTQ